MKSVVTATGVDELNKLMKKHPQISIIDIDIHKQELMWEKFVEPAYIEADVLVIMDKLSGPFSKYEMIKEVRNQFKGEIYVVLSEHDDEQFIRFLRELKITNIFTEEDDPTELIDAIVYELNEVAATIESQSGTEDAEKVEKVYISKQVLAVVGTGGSGKTTVAIDLAKLLISDKYDVCLVDLNLEKSDVGKIIGVEEKGIQAILKEEFSEGVIVDAVTRKKGIHYFTGLQDMIEISEAYKHIKGVIKVLRKHYDVVILDTGNISSFATHTAIMESDQQLFVFNPAERSIKAIRKYLDLYIKSLEKPLRASGLVNQYVETGLDIKDISDVLGIKIYGKIKFDKGIFMDIEKGKGFDKEKKVIKVLKDAMFLKKESKSLFEFFKKKVVN